MEEKEKRSYRTMLPLIIGNLILLAAILLFTTLFYHTLQKEIYLERTAYLEEITGQIVSTTEAVSTTQWDFAAIFANHLQMKGFSDREELSAYIVTEQEAFSQPGLSLLAFDENGRYYDGAGNRARWSGSIAAINDSAPARQVEIMTLSTTVSSDDEMVFVLKLRNPVLVEGDAIRLTHVAVVRDMNVFSETFSVPSFGGNGENYIISRMGTRIYRGQGSGRLFGDVYNVLKPMEGFGFRFGGSYQQLKQTVAAGEGISLEFSSLDGQAYYVTSSPMATNDWSLLSVVPAAVVSVKMQQFMNMALLGVAAIALIVMIAITLTMYFVVRYRAGQRLVKQQAKNNAVLKEAAETAQEANRAKSVFLSHMSHDIRTPINGIMGMTDIAVRNIHNRERVEDCLGKISLSSHHLLSLINDVLDMSRIESGKVELEQAPFRVDELLEGCYGVISGQALEKNQSLSKDFSGITEHYLLGDELHLRQIIINILGNAVKFTPEGGAVSILAENRMTSPGESELTVVVRDNGIGMTKEFQKRIFQPFSQAEDSGRSKYQGTGLGMSIVKQLMDLMKGTIEIESTPGAGSTFTIRIPLLTEAQPVREKADDSDVMDIIGMRVLLVEDNELNMEIARYLLEEHGARVTAAVNGQEALDLFVGSQEGSFDIILMDIMMPVMDGLTATRAIRSSGKKDAAAIPIVAMTANAYAEDRQSALEAGMNRHLAKPIEPEALIRVLSGIKSRGE